MGLHRGARAPAEGFTLLQNQNSQNQHQVKVVTLTLAPSRAKNRANAAWTAIPTIRITTVQVENPVIAGSLA